MNAADAVLTNIIVSVRGDDVVPEEIANTLALANRAEFSHRRGDPFTTVDGSVGKRLDGFCLIESGQDVGVTAPLDHHIKWYVDHVIPHKKILNEWLASGRQVHVMIATFIGSATLRPTVDVFTLGLLSSVGVPVHWREPRCDPAYVAACVRQAQKSLDDAT
jgi:hypothetical protein